MARLVGTVTGLGGGTWVNPGRLERDKWCTWSTIPFLKMAPGIPREAHWLLSDETLDLQRWSHSRHIDRMGHGLADLVVSSPWIHVSCLEDAWCAHCLKGAWLPRRGDTWCKARMERQSQNGEQVPPSSASYLKMEWGVWAPKRVAGKGQAS